MKIIVDVTRVTSDNHFTATHLDDDMSKNADISARILSNMANGMSLPEAYDTVFGAGAYVALAGEIYDALNAGVKA